MEGFTSIGATVTSRSAAFSSLPSMYTAADLAVSQFEVREAPVHSAVPAAGNTDAGYRKAFLQGGTPQKGMAAP